jgi:formylglycine-generating enzyme required for sulfatase activity
MFDGYDEKNTKANRLLRGGSWIYSSSTCTVVRRYDLVPTAGGNRYGFRVALSLVQ